MFPPEGKWDEIGPLTQTTRYDVLALTTWNDTRPLFGAARDDVHGIADILPRTRSYEGDRVTDVSTLGLQASFGFGDRIGLATPGHVEAMRRAGGGIAPIYAQQSIREMTRTNRTPEQVMGDALAGAKSAGWTGKQGA